MALNWLWENKCGTLKVTNMGFEYEHTLYDGNALMIALTEWEEDGEKLYNMYDYWVDEKHMERCLEDVSVSNYRTYSFRLNTKKIAKSKLNKIVKACIKYGIEITLYAEEEGAEK